MDGKNRKVELLAPAGNREKLEIAVHYGADAVYLGGKDFSLRNFSGNFSLEEMADAVAFAHGKNVRVYVACNIYPRTSEQEDIERYLDALGKIGPDAVIIADPGIVAMAGERIPHIPIHLSTQANTTSLAACRFWERQGVKRINLARELPLADIREISENTALEIETFVHGAMCISYSGRCLLSSFLTKRDSNRGECSHPCRWKYAVVEEQRPDMVHPFMEDERGSYIFNSKDLCMVEHIPLLIQSGIASLKIEGRMKGINYLASVVKVYREAIDSYIENPEGFRAKSEWLEELSRINSREYSTGFYFGDPDAVSPNYRDARPGTIHRFVGKILENTGPCEMKVAVRNRILKGDEIEVLTPVGPAVKDRVVAMTDKKGLATTVAQPNTVVTLSLSRDYAPLDLIRNGEESTYSDKITDRRPERKRDEG
jgi:putative protease